MWHGSSQKATRTNRSRRYTEGKSRRITFKSMDVYIERREMVAAGNDNLCALRCEQLGRGPTDARARAGDDRDLVVKTSCLLCHVRSPCVAASIAA